MKNLIASLILVLFTAACTQTGSQSSDTMQGGAMCEKCSCCQGMMKDGKMQCPMMKGEAKGGQQCACCQKMMHGEAALPVDEQAPAAGVSAEDHKQHHPAQ
jgi:hypothetical protein